MNNVNIKKTRPTATIPTKGSKKAAGYDLTNAGEEVLLAPGEKHLFPTGLVMEIPEGLYGRIAPRSGLANKNAIDVLAGVIDSDYRGEVGVILINHSKGYVPFKTGDRIAQIIFETYHDALFNEVSETDETNRGTGGFGSTGA